MPPKSSKPKRGRPRKSNNGPGASPKGGLDEWLNRAPTAQISDKDDETSGNAVEARKKRGRPSLAQAKASLANESAQTETTNPSIAVDSRPSKTRKRAAQYDNEASEGSTRKRRAIEESAGTQATRDIEPGVPPKARGRPPKSQKAKATAAPDTTATSDPIDGSEGPADDGSKRRGGRERRSAIDFPAWLGANESASFTASTPKEQPRKRVSTGQVSARSAATESAASRRRDEPGSGSKASAAAESTKLPGRRRGRPKSGTTSAKTADDTQEEQRDQSVSPVKNKGGRPPGGKARRKPPAQEEEPSSEAARPRKRRARHSSGSNEQEASKAAKEAAPKNRGRPAKSRKERTAPEESEVEDEPVEEEENEEDDMADFRQLQTLMRNIPRSVVIEKWQPLDSASIEIANGMLYDAFHPVLMRLQDRPQRYQQAHEALGVIASRIERKLREGLPFPKPSTKFGAVGGPRSGAGHEDELDFERPLKAMTAWESQLTALLDTEKLLTTTLEREELELEREYERLRELDKTARAEVRTWKDRGRRAHGLAPEPRTAREVEQAARYNRLEVKAENPVAGSIFQDKENTELQDLSVQLSSHMVSLQTNLKQVSGIAPEVLTSHGAIQQVLLQHLDFAEANELLTGVRPLL